MSTHDAHHGDIYVDSIGRLWRVTWTLPEPSLCMEEVEPYGATQIGIPEAGGDIKFYRNSQSGGVSGCMWDGFKRIWRKDAPEGPA